MLVVSTKVASAGVDPCDENIAALFGHGAALDYAPAELRADREVVVAAAAQSWQDYAPAELEADREVVFATWAGPRLRPCRAQS